MYIYYWDIFFFWNATKVFPSKKKCQNLDKCNLFIQVKCHNKKPKLFFKVSLHLKRSRLLRHMY